MNTRALIGILLIVVGVAALAYQSITYTTRETVIDLGPIEATAERRRTIPVPPVIGAVTVAAGVILLVVSRRRR